MTVGSMHADAAAAEVAVTTNRNTSIIEAFPRGRAFHEKYLDWGKNSRYSVVIAPDEVKSIVTVLSALTRGEDNTLKVSDDENNRFVISLASRPNTVSVRFVTDEKPRACGFYSREAVVSLLDQITG